MAYKPYFESYTFQEGLLDAAKYVAGAVKKQVADYKQKSAQKEVTDPVKLFQKEPRDIIQIALNKYKKDYQKAYNYLKTIANNDLDEHETEKEHALDVVDMMRRSIMKVFKFDPDKKTGGKNSGGYYNLGMDDEDEVILKGKSWQYIAKKYIDMFYRNPEKSFNALASRVKEAVKTGEIQKGSKDYANALDALRSIKNKVDKENEQYELDKEKKAKAAQPAPQPAPAPEPVQSAAEQLPPLDKAREQLLDKLKGSEAYTGKAELLKIREKQLNSLPDDKMRELIKAVNENPKNLVATVTAFVKQKPGQ